MKRTTRRKRTGNRPFPPSRVPFVTNPVGPPSKIWGKRMYRRTGFAVVIALFLIGFMSFGSAFADKKNRGDRQSAVGARRRYRPQG